MICTVLYILVRECYRSGEYKNLNVPDRCHRPLDSTGVGWAVTSEAGRAHGLTSTIVVMLLGQSRYFSPCRGDRLLPTVFSTVIRVSNALDFHADP